MSSMDSMENNRNQQSERSLQTESQNGPEQWLEYYKAAYEKEKEKNESESDSNE